ncbi:hypothetical protein [Photobacterium leiognathi]|uniref:hypothetical protein n=1 Tax=Photobacterium leiognathi TaxID=553611 RepID=UPI0027385F3B|nr:hypothetical protein [Photobacterium leiognathi]
MNDAIIIKAIYNEYNLYKYHNKKKGNLINKFRPYSNKVTDYLLLVLSFFFVPIVPFIPFFNKVSISTSSYDCNMYFICSEKSKIIFSKNTKSNFIDITRGDKYHVTLKGYLNYLKVIYLFFYTIRLKIWFYPSVTLLYQMIRIYGYLSENKGSIKEINITNHYDRWAIFFGEIANEFDIKLNIYQHGILDCDYKPFYKIPKVNNVYAYDELSGNIFSCDLILDCNKVIIKKPTVGVAEVKQHKKSVLIIGTVDVTYLTIEKKNYI